MKISKRVRDEFREFGRQGGEIGGKKSLETMTPKARKKRASDAAKARWAKAKEALWSPDIDRVVQREMDKADGVRTKAAKEKK